VSKATKLPPRATLRTGDSGVRVSGETKRKRHSGKALDESSQTSRDDIVSPTKKMSKCDKPDPTQHDGNDESVDAASHAAVEEVSEIE
jgi:hypothetical protein